VPSFIEKYWFILCLYEFIVGPRPLTLLLNLISTMSLWKDIFPICISKCKVWLKTVHPFFFYEFLQVYIETNMATVTLNFGIWKRVINQIIAYLLIYIVTPIFRQIQLFFIFLWIFKDILHIKNGHSDLDLWDIETQTSLHVNLCPT
jgi:hypothetical protein